MTQNRAFPSQKIPLSLCLLVAAVLTACGGGDPNATPPSSAGDFVAGVSGSAAQPDSTALLNSSHDDSSDELAAGLPVGLDPALASAQAPAIAPPPATVPGGGGVIFVGAPTPAPSPPAPISTPSPAPAKSTNDVGCGEDIGGWTLPAPSKADSTVALRSMQQPGSRIYYISAAHGSDKGGEIYFWDGNRIIDSAGKSTDSAGQAYGSDPMNPSAAVKPFMRWSYVGPRSTATGDVGTPGNVGAPTSSARAGFPDWWLFARGETFDLTDDLLSFARETNPAVTNLGSSLSVPGGRSITERQIVGAYGNVCTDRPRFIHPQNGFVTRYANPAAPAMKNVAYLSLHFDGHDRAAAGWSGITLLGQSTASVDILFEDIWLDGMGMDVDGGNAGQVTLNRSLITDSFVTNGIHAQGIYYYGAKQGQMRIQDSILLRNGFSRGDPQKIWPPSGTQTWDLFSRNMYISGETSSMQSGIFDSVSMIGGSGDQFRAGWRVERNFFYNGYVGMGAHNGYPDSAGATGTFLDNVLQRFTGKGTDDNRGQPGWGIALAGGAYQVQVARNIVTGAQSPATSSAIQLSPLYGVCGVPFTNATRNNTITNNIFDSGSASAAVSVNDGSTASTSCFLMPGLGVHNNNVSNNVLINSHAKESEYLPSGVAVGTSPDTVYQSNRMFATRAAAASALGATGMERTLKTYLESMNVTVTSADGFSEYFQQATQMRRGQWRTKWTSRELVNYFRSGFGMPLLLSQ